eukprot:2897109-Amphidinium_carterae.1
MENPTSKLGKGTSKLCWMPTYQRREGCWQGQGQLDSSLVTGRLFICGCWLTLLINSFCFIH